MGQHVDVYDWNFTQDRNPERDWQIVAKRVATLESDGQILGWVLHDPAFEAIIRELIGRPIQVGTRVISADDEPRAFIAELSEHLARTSTHLQATSLHDENCAFSESQEVLSKPIKMKRPPIPA